MFPISIVWPQHYVSAWYRVIYSNITPSYVCIMHLLDDYMQYTLYSASVTHCHMVRVWCYSYGEGWNQRMDFFLFCFVCLS